jgi:hypothetical protein
MPDIPSTEEIDSEYEYEGPGEENEVDYEHPHWVHHQTSWNKAVKGSFFLYIACGWENVEWNRNGHWTFRDVLPSAPAPRFPRPHEPEASWDEYI